MCGEFSKDGFLIVVIIIIMLSTGVSQPSQSLSEQNQEKPLQLNFRLASEDLIFETPTKLNGKVRNLSNSRYYYISDKNSTKSFNSGDTIVEINNYTKHNRSELYHLYNFSNKIAYITKKNQSQNYQYKYDIFKIEAVNENLSAPVNNSYHTPVSNQKFLSGDADNAYTGKEPIFASSDRQINENDKVLRSGNGNYTNNLTESDYEYWEDRESSPGYSVDPAGGYGEPIYDTGGDGEINANRDRRVTEVNIYSGTDSNVTTIDYRLDRSSLVKENDPDIGKSLTALKNFPTVNEFDPDGSKNTAIGEFGKEDAVVIDTTGDSIYSSDDDIVLTGNIPNGTRYSVSSCQGKWKYGAYTKNSNIKSIIFDKGNDGSSSTNLFITDDEIVFGTEGIYTDRTGEIRFFDTTPHSSDFQKGDDGLFVDIGVNGISTGEFNDLRLTNYEITYGKNTTVKAIDLDSNINMRDFQTNVKTIDLNSDGELDYGEPLLESINDRTDPSDHILIGQEELYSSLSKLGDAGDGKVLIEGKSGLSKDDRLIKLHPNYPISSRNYSIENISAGAEVGVHSFSRSTQELVLHSSGRSEYRDGEPIIGISNIKPLNRSLENSSKPVKVQAFPDSFGYISNNSSLGDKAGIYKEKDTDIVGTDTFGDRLDAVTVSTNGTLSDQYVESISLSGDGAQIATASTPTANGTWVLEPTGEKRWFGPDTWNTTFTLDASIAEDAPGGTTLALEIPPVADADGDGAYDPGDTGLFLDQGPPIGDVGPGAALTVERTSGRTEPPTGPLALALEAPANVSHGADVPIEIAANRSERRDLNVELRSVGNESAVAETTTALDANGETRVAFAPSLGQYRVHVSAVNGNASAVSEPIRVQGPSNVSIQSGIENLERGEQASVTFEARGTDAATLHLDGPGNRSETARLSLRNGSGSYAIGVESGGGRIRTNGSGLSLAAANGTAELRWLTALAPAGDRKSRNGAAATSSSGNAKRGNARARASNRSENGSNNRPPSLPAGRYALSLTTPDGNGDSLEFAVTAAWEGTVQPLVAPRDVELESVGDVRTHATRAGEIATGDRLVVAVETPVFDNRTDRIAVGGPPANATHGNRSATNRSRGRNQSAATPPAFVSVGPARHRRGGRSLRGLQRINASEPGRFYVVAPLDDGTVRPGTSLETALTLTEETAVVPAAANDTATASRTATLDVIKANATLNGVSRNGTLDLPTGRSVPVNGTATVAPGTTATVHLRGANGSFHYERETTVSADGTYETVLNVSDRDPGEAYSITVTADGDQLSPVRSGEFVGSDATGLSAAQGGGGGGGGYAPNRGATAPTVTDRTVEPTPTRTPADGPPPVPVPEISSEAVRRTWDRLTDPMVLGLPSLLVIAFGGLAVVVISVGVKRLFDP